LSKLPRISGKELCEIVGKLGFVHTHTTGSHHMYKHSNGRKITIPVHANEELGPGLLLRIIKVDLKLTREEFLELV